MQQKITVICPKCRTKNTVARPPAQGGQITCLHCNHQFKVVPRSRPTASSSATNPQAAPSHPVATDKTTSDNIFANKAAFIERVRQAKDNQKTPTGLPAFNSLLSQSVNQNIDKSSQPAKASQVATKNIATHANLVKNINQINTQSTPVSTTTVSPNTGHAMVASEINQNPNNPNPDTVALNNLNNLVFTLLPNAEVHKQTDVPLLLNDAIEKTDAIHAKTQYLHDQQDKLSKEFNWTLASLVALTVLMMQLFYLMAVK